MPDLRVDTEALRRTQATLSDIGQRLEAATSGFASISGASVAHADLRSRLDELGSSWGIGLKKLGEYAGGAATALNGVADAFEGTDDALADALSTPPSQAASHRPGGAR
ncbi:MULTISPECIES: hypothetical protein [unclassified Microbacterium]|uniref:hypothetical protein n=1 Tax=unclassified Microbacterium TaxID=2609290 RepID=UPI00214C79C6|nr:MULTISPECIES: hypothetical protein [unclassified Microbacterium]MCR2799781.1 hypothetical protein [Microbacterium sp. zg.Y818]MCR2825041.1 hypothetical protein [Microbacterium sp. zg.Y909]WIM21765.1 hypothetical protein QNO21_11665 [Microbacterium sp. zg-Y818]